jgi:hypothetical protein
MFWFVVATVFAMLYVIDLTTNVHLLVTRRLARRRERRRAEVPIAVPSGADRSELLHALHEARAA